MPDDHTHAPDPPPPPKRTPEQIARDIATYRAEPKGDVGSPEIDAAVERLIADGSLAYSEEPPPKRCVSVPREDILGLIICADGYGLAHQVLFCDFANWLGDLSDEEIEDQAAAFLTPEMRAQRYGEEDAENAREALHEFRDKYMKDDP